MTQTNPQLTKQINKLDCDLTKTWQFGDGAMKYVVTHRKTGDMLDVRAIGPRIKFSDFYVGGHKVDPMEGELKGSLVQLLAAKGVLVQAITGRPVL